MLITEMKSAELLRTQLHGSVFLIRCHGCREVHFPLEQADAFCHELEQAGLVTGSMTTDYICNPELLRQRLAGHTDAIEKAQTILVFSCGVGVQTVARMYESKRVCAACDTIALPGFQGVTPLQHSCGQCGECYLNLTGGICPITACSKSLLNGQCGGAKNGMCEVDPTMECGWERIIRALTQVGRPDALKCPVQVRTYASGDSVK